ncbi:SusC/RagA family TonB-linked outer membrane protein [Pedobacter sp. PWIIR3]
MNQNFTKITTKVLFGIFFYLLIPWHAFAQGSLTGTVLDETKKPVPGVTVMEKGTKNGTMTNADGKFALKLTKPDAIVEAKMIGYVTKELSAAGKTTLVFNIAEDNQTLSEVVMVGYQTISRKKSTSAISSISGKELANLPTASFDQLLQGRLAGVNVQNFTGQPGAAPTVSVRGNSQINSSYNEYNVINTPLYVVDGIPQPAEEFTAPGAGTGTNYLAGINPADIESIDVLKDAAAAAIYGSRGANGVIMITTKKGVSGEPRITLNSFAGFVERPNLRDATLGTTERRQKLDILQRQLTYDQLRNLPAILTDSLNPAYNANTDWQDLFYKRAYTQNADLGISGGSDNGITYRFSGGYYNEEGVVKGTGFKRYSTRLTMSTRAANQKLLISPMFYFSRTDRARGNGDPNDPANPIRLGAGNMPSSLINLSPEKAAFYLDPTSGNLDKNIGNQLTINLNLTYEFGKHLVFNSQNSMLYNNTRRDRSLTSLLNNGLGNSSYSFTDVTLSPRTSNYFTYNNQFSKHSVSFVLGQDLDYTQNQSTTAAGFGGASDNIQTVSGYQQSRILANSDYQAFGQVSYYARGNYDFDSRYFVTFTARTDGSSKFGKNNKWAYFPSATLGWLVTEEKFMKDMENSPLTKMMIRASIGRSGNLPKGLGQNYLQYNIYNVNNGSYNGNLGATSYNGVTAITPNFVNGAAQNSLSWEKSLQWNIGTDIEFKNGRYGISLDAYNKESTDLLFDVLLPVTTGYDQAKTNALGVRNNGYELSLRATPIEKGFKWNTNFNISYNKNTIMNLPNGNRDIVFSGDRFDKSHILSVGSPLNAFYLYRTKGVYSRLSDVPVNPLTGAKYSSQGEYGAGDFYLEDLDGNFMVDVFNDGINPDKLPVGDPNPKWTGGFSNNFTYKNFTLGVFATFTLDRDVLNLFDSDRFANSQDGNAISNFASYSTPDFSKINIWRQPGDVADYAKYDIGTYRYYYTSAQTFFLEKGGYLRIKSVNIGYNLPSNTLKKMGFGKFYVYALVDNLAMFQQSKKLPDAEAVNPYGEYKGTGYPIPKKFVLGLDIQF